MNAPTNSPFGEDTEPEPHLVVLAGVVISVVVALSFWKALPLLLDLTSHGLLAVGAGLITLIAVLLLGFDRRLKRVAQVVAEEVNLRD